MNSTTVSISINASWLEGEALQRWASILKRAHERSRLEGFSGGTTTWPGREHIDRVPLDR